MKSVESGGTSNASYVQDATYRLSDGSVYTKYNWALYVVRDSVHGLMNTNPAKPEEVGLGVWNIPCSREWYPGGPMKQELTVHATGKSPITIQMLQGEHFGTSSVTYQPGQKKLYGPFLIYINSGTRQHMIADAKREAHEQEQQWPFKWFSHERYPLDRAMVTGRINVTTGQRKDSIQVVLCESGTELYRQTEGYVFWALTDAEGRFCIKNVRKGNYALRAYATTGDITDELLVKNVNIEDDEVDINTFTWTPTRHEHQLFIIGENNRMSDGFRLSDTLRNYGLWNMVPASLTYEVGKSKPEIDWWYAQTKNGTWTIVFNCDEEYEGDAVFSTSIAGVTNTPKVAVAINGTTLDNWSFAANDAAIYRSAVLSGRHQTKTCTFNSSLLKKGENRLTLTMSGIGGNGGVMWDCLKLETGNLITSNITNHPESDSGYIRIYNLKGMLIGTYLHQLPVKLNIPTGIYIYQQGNKRKKIYIK
jgi:rhamnogalacturonan endolyase